MEDGAAGVCNYGQAALAGQLGRRFHRKSPQHEHTTLCQNGQPEPIPPRWACNEPLTTCSGLGMRDAGLRAPLDMYAASSRCLARVQRSRGLPFNSSSAPRRFLSSLGGSSAARRRRRAHGDPHALAGTVAASSVAPLAGCPRGSRHYIANVQTPTTIAVLGGGLTGLTTAWYLTRVLPKARITLYEASDRLGGWVDTEQVEVRTPDGRKGTVRFERAARMVKPQTSGRVARYDDLVFFDMVRASPFDCCLVRSRSPCR